MCKFVVSCLCGTTWKEVTRVVAVLVAGVAFVGGLAVAVVGIGVGLVAGSPPVAQVGFYGIVSAIVVGVPALTTAEILTAFNRYEQRDAGS